MINYEYRFFASLRMTHTLRIKNTLRMKNITIMKKNIILLATLLMATLWTGCQKVDEGEIQPRPGKEDNPAGEVWNITVKAVKTDGAETKGMAIGEGGEAATTELKSIWKTGEKVAVYKGTTWIGELTVTPESDAHNATLSGTITTTGITPNTTELTLITPSTRFSSSAANWDYTGQVGKLLIADDAENSIEKKYHYTMAAGVTVSGVTGNNITTETANFANQQSIYRLSFRFQNPNDTKTAITAKSVTIKSANNKLVQSQAMDGTSVKGPISVTLATATVDPFFVALRNLDETNTEDLTFTVIDNDGVTYKGTKEVPAGYKPNGIFVSIKNATLTERLGVSLSATTSTVAW